MKNMPHTHTYCVHRRENYIFAAMKPPALESSKLEKQSKMNNQPTNELTYVNVLTASSNSFRYFNFEFRVQYIRSPTRKRKFTCLTHVTTPEANLKVVVQYIGFVLTVENSRFFFFFFFTREIFVSAGTFWSRQFYNLHNSNISATDFQFKVPALRDASDYSCNKNPHNASCRINN